MVDRIVTNQRSRRFAYKFACLTLAALAAFDGYRLWYAEYLNHAIANGSIAAYQGNLPAEAVFAQAYFTGQKQDHERSLALYKRLESTASTDLAMRAKYNRGNDYLRQAQALREAGGEQISLPLVEQAKEAYRGVLRMDSTYWDAKYNLERALRLVPEPDDLAEADLPAPQQAERAVTTMRGESLGLP
jgi:mxaK protein